MKYKCVNKDCQLFDKIKTIAKAKLIYNKELDRVETKDSIVCFFCGQELEYVEEPGEISVHVNVFESRTPEEKREIMHKRSVDHFNKTDKGDLARYKQQMIDRIKNKVEG